MKDANGRSYVKGTKFSSYTSDFRGYEFYKKFGRKFVGNYKFGTSPPPIAAPIEPGFEPYVISGYVLSGYVENTI